MLVPKSCLAAGSGKDGGFSRKTPDIAVRSPRWARAGVLPNPKWSARDETMELVRGANRIGFRFSFTVSACGPRSIYSGAKSLAALGCAEYSAAAPSVTSVPLVPPSAAALFPQNPTERQRKEKQSQFVDIPGPAPKAAICGISVIRLPRFSALG